jgi:hypothetical protein
MYVGIRGLSQYSPSAYPQHGEHERNNRSKRREYKYVGASVRIVNFNCEQKCGVRVAPMAPG